LEVQRKSISSQGSQCESGIHAIIVDAHNDNRSLKQSVNVSSIDSSMDATDALHVGKGSHINISMNKDNSWASDLGNFDYD